MVFGPAPDAQSPLAARSSDAIARGTLVHQLLQHAPTLPVAAREPAIRAYCTRAGIDVADEVLAILTHPDLAPLFGPAGRAEQPLTGVVDGVVISGLVDRLAVLPDAVLVADYKTNRAAPHEPGATPAALSPPDGRLPRPAAPDLPRPPDPLRADLDPRRPHHALARFAAGQPCSRSRLIMLRCITKSPPRGGPDRPSGEFT